MDLTFISEQGKLNIRVAAIILQNGKVLLEKSNEFGFYGFIGGRVKFSETAEHAIERELYEELGEKPNIIRPLYVAQNLFEMGGDKYHELCFYFLVEVSQKLFNKKAFKNFNGSNVFYWLDVDNLFSVNVVPRYIKDNINNLPDKLELITLD